MDAEIAKRPATYLDSAQVQSNEQVFKNVYIPRSLVEIQSIEDDIQKMRQGDDDDLLYKSVTGIQVKLDKNVALDAAGQAAIDRPGETQNPATSEITARAADYGISASKRGSPGRGSSSLRSRSRKRLAKEERREKLKSKTPKSIKKRKEKMAADRKRK
eukprot:jgi/Hompol1/6821/HPOL_001136-RA